MPDCPAGFPKKGRGERVLTEESLIALYVLRKGAVPVCVYRGYYGIIQKKVTIYFCTDTIPIHFCGTVFTYRLLFCVEICRGR